VKRRTGFFMTALAVIFLLLNGILLGWVGLALGRLLFLALSGAFFVATGIVVMYFRRHLKNLADLREAQQTLQSEMEGMLEAARANGAPSHPDRSTE
jgi:hypothetical protein